MLVDADVPKLVFLGHWLNDCDGRGGSRRRRSRGSRREVPACLVGLTVVVVHVPGIRINDLVTRCGNQLLVLYEHAHRRKGEIWTDREEGDRERKREREKERERERSPSPTGLELLPGS